MKHTSVDVVALMNIAQGEAGHKEKNLYFVSVVYVSTLQETQTT